MEKIKTVVVLRNIETWWPSYFILDGDYSQFHDVCIGCDDSSKDQYKKELELYEILFYVNEDKKKSDDQLHYLYRYEEEEFCDAMEAISEGAYYIEVGFMGLGLSKPK